MNTVWIVSINNEGTWEPIAASRRLDVAKQVAERTHAKEGDGETLRWLEVNVGSWTFQSNDPLQSPHFSVDSVRYLDGWSAL